MSSSSRAPPGGRASSVRNPRPSTTSTSSRYQSHHSVVASRIDRTTAPSPAGSIASVSTVGMKRKERDYEAAENGGHAGPEETNINVVVRCRGRNEREVRENSAVVLRTDGVKGKLIDLSMGPNALSNKSYNFDRVFSSAADQNMIFDDVVKPILEEMLLGFNCTIFAYGQTGTGKTFTMSGDMSETMGLLSDSAGIIPRVLHSLFNKLQMDDAENCVKCSFIELYNEELRDLVSTDDSVKLKIYDDISRKGHSTTIVQGMEEKHIKTAGEGIKVLQDGSVKRKVAATKCNDLSSRSHTVFTITASFVKRNSQGEQEYVTTGKLNLVDLAGSENIQRSGAENKRAAEAGLINKSLLTLGRVINALVDRSPHIPYRESKLTRLLQDSLGGRTKTCIIATVSPAKSNLEETISTLDYAFRAKNIRNKPQLNLLLSKNILLQDFTNEIEKLKSELIATRQRNGVYLSNEAYEEMSADRESRRIVMEEQGAKIETLEANLRNKVHELFELTSTFMGMKKDLEGTKSQLDETKGLLNMTEVVLSTTRQSLEDESHMRKAHQQTEERLAEIGGQLISKLRKTVHDVGGLHAKNKRKSDLQSLNRAAWGSARGQVADITSMVERRVRQLQDDQEESVSNLSQRMQAFVGEELQNLSSTKTFLDEQLDKFVESKTQMLEQQQKSKEDMDNVLEEIKDVRDAVKQRVGDSLQAIAAAAERIAADVLAELSTFHNQLHGSYSSLGQDFKGIFEDLTKHLNNQRAESDVLRDQLKSASSAIVDQNKMLSAQVEQVLEEERKQAASDRQALMVQITSLISAQAEQQEARLAAKTSILQQQVDGSSTALEGAMSNFDNGMDSWNQKEAELVETVKESRDKIKTKLKDDWTSANNHSTLIQETTQSVHAETVRVVEEQVRDLDVHMEELDDFVTRARSENLHQHDTRVEAMQNVSATVEQSLSKISTQFSTTFDRVRTLGADVDADTKEMADQLAPSTERICEPLAELRTEMSGTTLREYEPTGETPEKTAYHFPTVLPRTKLYSSTTRFSSSLAAGSSAAAHTEDVDNNDNDDDEDDDDNASSPTPSKRAKISTSSSPSSVSTPVSPSIPNSLASSTSAPAPPCPVFADLAHPSTANMTNNSSSDAAAAAGAAGTSSADRQPLGVSLREVNLNMSTAVASNPFDPSAAMPPPESTAPLYKRSIKAPRTGALAAAAAAAAASLASEGGAGAPRKAGSLIPGAPVAEGRENMPHLLSSGGPATRRKSPRFLAEGGGA